MDQGYIVRTPAERSGPTSPELRRAILMCGSCRKPHWHKFIVNRRSGEVGAYEQVFACETCHTERRYGLVG